MATTLYQGTEIRTLCLNMLAGGSITPYEFVKLDGTDENEVVACSSQGEHALGVAIGRDRSETIAAGEPVTVLLIGICEVKSGDTVVLGAQITTGANADLDPAATGDYVLGRALVGSASGGLTWCAIDCVNSPIVA